MGKLRSKYCPNNGCGMPNGACQHPDLPCDLCGKVYNRGERICPHCKTCRHCKRIGKKFAKDIECK